MNHRWSVTGIFLVIFLNYAISQVPPRLQIPGAISVGVSRPGPFRPQSAPSPRLRRPNTLPSGVREVRPVVEEIEEPNYPSPSPVSAFDDEVNKLGQLSLQSSRDDEDGKIEDYRYRSGSSERATPLPFRPERPVPIAREQIREKSVSRPPPPPPPTRPVIREDAIPVRQAPIRQQVSRPAPAPQTVRALKAPPRQQAYDDDEDLRDRKRKPVTQILRKYRTDNEDGSITWGFETDDGTFKEETLGADCIIRGNYGYFDPDGVKREFSYETGNKCDEPEPDEEDLLPQKPNIPQSKNRPLPYRPAQAAPQPQYVN